MDRKCWSRLLVNEKRLGPCQTRLPLLRLIGLWCETQAVGTLPKVEMLQGRPKVKCKQAPDFGGEESRNWEGAPPDSRKDWTADGGAHCSGTESTSPASLGSSCGQSLQRQLGGHSGLPPRIDPNSFEAPCRLIQLNTFHSSWSLHLDSQTYLIRLSTPSATWRFFVPFDNHHSFILCIWSFLFTLFQRLHFDLEHEHKTQTIPTDFDLELRGWDFVAQICARLLW